MKVLNDLHNTLLKTEQIGRAESLGQECIEKPLKRKIEEHPNGVASAMKLANRCSAFRLKEADYPLWVISYITEISQEEIERMQIHPLGI